MPLSQFAEPIESLPIGDFKAYRMDSTKEGSNMRAPPDLEHASAATM